MEGSLICPHPVKLVSVESSPPFLTLEEKGLGILKRECKGTPKIVSIIGKYRTGKSFVMNELLGEKKGFDLGHLVRGETKGVWLWGKNCPDGSCVLCLDFEGLYDVEETPEKDLRLSLLSVLLSSIMIVNVQNVLDSENMEMIKFAGDMAEHIRGKRIERNSFEKHLPSLMFLIRDFHLSLGKYKTAERYLEEILSERRDDDDDDDDDDVSGKDHSKWREKIRKSFRSRTCFTLVRPVERDEDLRIMEDDRSVIKPEFIKQMSEVIKYILSQLRPKVISNGDAEVHLKCGVDFAAYVEEIVNLLTAKSALICIPDLFNGMVNRRREEYKKQARFLYTTQMEKYSENFPIDDDTLSKYHTDAVLKTEQELSDMVDGLSMKDIQHNFRCQVGIRKDKSEPVDEADMLRNVYDRRNTEASLKQCREWYETKKGEIKSMISTFSSLDHFNLTAARMRVELERMPISEAAKIRFHSEFNNHTNQVGELILVRLKLSEEEKMRMSEEMRRKNAEEEMERLSKIIAENEARHKREIAELKEASNSDGRTYSLNIFSILFILSLFGVRFQ
eukprot:TRINITY_DN241_c0_g1_i1.p1 TRINITY_DN241_c0_g1~~TRINITY_DN241_c0_g1_i1.p1  ORF type:complete len:589 (+),score=155.55 TRINITY_DN241_c0_g1_i1:83-1768(+)